MTQTGGSTGQDRNTCRELVAADEQDPKILKDLGLKQRVRHAVNTLIR